MFNEVFCVFFIIVFFLRIFVEFLYSSVLYVLYEEVSIDIEYMRRDRPRQICIESNVEGFFECNTSAFHFYFFKKK